MLVLGAMELGMYSHRIVFYCLKFLEIFSLILLIYLIEWKCDKYILFNNINGCVVHNNIFKIMKYILNRYESKLIDLTQLIDPSQKIVTVYWRSRNRNRQMLRYKRVFRVSRHQNPHSAFPHLYLHRPTPSLDSPSLDSLSLPLYLRHHTPISSSQLQASRSRRCILSSAWGDLKPCSLQLSSLGFYRSFGIWPACMHPSLYNLEVSILSLSPFFFSFWFMWRCRVVSSGGVVLPLSKELLSCAGSAMRTGCCVWILRCLCLHGFLSVLYFVRCFWTSSIGLTVDGTGTIGNFLILCSLGRKKYGEIK